MLKFLSIFSMLLITVHPFFYADYRVFTGQGGEVRGKTKAREEEDREFQMEDEADKERDNRKEKIEVG